MSCSKYHGAMESCAVNHGEGINCPSVPACTHTPEVESQNIMKKQVELDKVVFQMPEGAKKMLNKLFVSYDGKEEIEFVPKEIQQPPIDCLDNGCPECPHKVLSDKVVSDWEKRLDEFECFWVYSAHGMVPNHEEIKQFIKVEIEKAKSEEQLKLHNILNEMKACLLKEKDAMSALGFFSKLSTIKEIHSKLDVALLNV